MSVEWSARGLPGRRVAGPLVTQETDFVGKVALTGLPSGERIRYWARFDDAAPIAGSFGTAPEDARDVVIAWSGDTNGQGWGIDPARGGMPAYAALLARRPDLFIHCGDAIYADDPIRAAVQLDDGTVWKNVVDDAKLRVAETLDDFRGAHRYPRRCAEVRALSAEVPLFAIWDDHEVRNNWYPGQPLNDFRYRTRSVDGLFSPALRAWTEYMPTLHAAPMYRVVRWGPLVDVFLLDGRSHRSANEPAPTAFLGATQAAWLAKELRASTAVWKVVASDMPIGVSVWEPGVSIARSMDGWANGEPGLPGGREEELANVLRSTRDVPNVVWVTADVHYAAAHRFDPGRAAFTEFGPFWELVAGPMHATTFPRKEPDPTFGTEVVWATDGGGGSPANGAQHFGLLHVDGKTRAMTVTFVDARGRDLHRLVLEPRT
jgi:alkaline phosphatase D